MFLQVLWTCWVFQSCVFFFFSSSSTLAGRLDNEWQNRWINKVCHSPVCSGCSCTNQDAGLSKSRGGAPKGQGECLQHPVSPRHAYSTRTHAYAHTPLLRSKRVFPVWPMNQRGGGRPNNGVTQWEAGEGSCTLRAAAIKAWGSNGEHLAVEHHSHSPPFVYRDEGVRAERKGLGLAERLLWPWGECGQAQRQRGQVCVCSGWGTSKSFTSQRLKGGAHVQHCCSTLRADDSEAQIFAPSVFYGIVKSINCKQNNNNTSVAIQLPTDGWKNHTGF